MRREDKVLLIGGSGRSGTTVLCRAFGCHPDISNVPEWRFMTDPGGVVDFYSGLKYGPWTPFKYHEEVIRLEKNLSKIQKRGLLGSVLGASLLKRLFFKFFGINVSPKYARTDASAYSPNFGKIKNQFIESLVDFKSPGYWVGSKFLSKAELSFALKGTRENLGLLCARFLRDVADDVCDFQKAKFHLEKNTWNILCFNRTLELLPEAKLVHIVRDPRDVVASYGAQSWVPSDYIRSAQVYRDLMDEWLKVKNVIPSNSYIEVRLEDLTQDPILEYKRICEFWGVSWHEDLMQIKLSGSSFGRWKKDIPEAVADEVCEIVRPVCEMYGYEV
ncbi:hypothetical protein GP5015_431 [gamma proteobacterium HTCC5015]|nr:hypothetical protein GP5015_431 [gamma proteobacterium HTCC5015]